MRRMTTTSKTTKTVSFLPRGLLFGCFPSQLKLSCQLTIVVVAPRVLTHALSLLKCKHNNLAIRRLGTIHVDESRGDEAAEIQTGDDDGIAVRSSDGVDASSAASGGTQTQEDSRHLLEAQRRRPTDRHKRPRRSERAGARTRRAPRADPNVRRPRPLPENFVVEDEAHAVRCVRFG